MIKNKKGFIGRKQKKCNFAADEKYNAMERYYPIKDSEIQEVNEPQVAYNASAKKSLRTITDEELERSMTLDELDTHLTELIHDHFHGK